ncbi:MarR family winged helix-turn-helix transcriptional regulator [Streptomyces sp. NPDC005549]|uniref:MarR family winged helix-turn-helix transcriptional regulator n=1 Tax=Streptomyces sp. NPDC005549 TaxID=3154888 RepID=UPI0033A4AC87
MEGEGDNSDKGEVDCDCDLGWSIGMLLRHYRAQAESCTADLPRGIRGYQLLYTVVSKNLANQSQLAGYLGIDRSVPPYVIDDLVRAGLVERQPDPADRRARKVVATALGIETFRALQNQVTSAEESVLAALGPAEQKQFRSLPSRLARQARDDANRAGRTASVDEL